MGWQTHRCSVRTTIPTSSLSVPPHLLPIFPLFLQAISLLLYLFCRLIFPHFHGVSLALSLCFPSVHLALLFCSLSALLLILSHFSPLLAPSLCPVSLSQSLPLPSYFLSPLSLLWAACQLLFPGTQPAPFLHFASSTLHSLPLSPLPLIDGPTILEGEEGKQRKKEGGGHQNTQTHTPKRHTYEHARTLGIVHIATEPTSTHTKATASICARTYTRTEQQEHTENQSKQNIGARIHRAVCRASSLTAWDRHPHTCSSTYTQAQIQPSVQNQCEIGSGAGSRII